MYILFPEAHSHSICRRPAHPGLLQILHCHVKGKVQTQCTLLAHALSALSQHTLHERSVHNESHAPHAGCEPACSVQALVAPSCHLSCRTLQDQSRMQSVCQHAVCAIPGFQLGLFVFFSTSLAYFSVISICSIASLGSTWRNPCSTKIILKKMLKATILREKRGKNARNHW